MKLVHLVGFTTKKEGEQLLLKGAYLDRHLQRESFGIEVTSK